MNILKQLITGIFLVPVMLFAQQQKPQLLGDDALTDYRLEFQARTLPNANGDVQIWAAFRAASRFDRYVVGVKGGLIDEVYLMRQGYMGTDELMGVRPLRFHPQPGEWQQVRVEAVGQRIRVFVGSQPLPYIDVTDPNGAAASHGGVELGLGWLPTEFKDAKVTPLSADAFASVSDREFNPVPTAAEKEAKRQQQLAAYHGIKVESLNAGRTDFSLDGNWLFMPITSDCKGNYSHPSLGGAGGGSTEALCWHVMPVPSFWNPIRIWLHGETMPSPRGQQPKGVSDRYYFKESDRCEQYTFDYRKTNAALYSQYLTLPADVKDKQMTLHFDAVSKAAEVYVNGTLAGSHIGMFGEFDIDCTALLHAGENRIDVKVTKNTTNQSDLLNDLLDAHYASARDNETKEIKKDAAPKDLLSQIAHGFYGNDPAGIWQPVRLIVTDKVRVEDVYIKPRLDGASFEVTVRNHGGKRATFDLRTAIRSKKTLEQLYEGLSLSKVTLAPGEERVLTYDISDLKPLLWSPEHPNLYDFTFNIGTDLLTITSGFKTFEVRPDGHFYLNGVRYWLRGGNQAPSAICPNDSALAHKFFQLMREGHIAVTRTHTSPYNELWMQAADEEGVGISFEGTYTWLMHGDDPIPSPEVMRLWKDEWLNLIHKYRNHPSLLYWTINNEMKFYDNDPDTERARQKMQIISDVVREMRQADPLHPICFDSNYTSKGKKEKFGADFMAGIDDGDIDDQHAYYNWYDFSLFRFFNGEFQKDFKMPGRPLISQEMSTGYPNNETGHPTRSYQLIHQNPLSLIGYKCYDWADPQYFLQTQAFITGELAEALRRSNPDADGFLHFSLHTWFKQAYDAKAIKPWPTYHALSRALQPVLVSAELWGRHLYSGNKLTTRFYVVNDREDGSSVKPSVIDWQIIAQTLPKGGELKVLACGQEHIREVKHSEHFYIEPSITIPEVKEKQNVRLLLSLKEGGQEISHNEYVLTIAPMPAKSQTSKRIAVLGDASQLDFLGVAYTQANLKKLNPKKTDLLIINGPVNCDIVAVTRLQRYRQQGGRLLILNSKELARRLFPEYIEDWIIPTEGDICFMEREDDPVFQGIDPMELRYWNNDRREMPLACTATLKTRRCAEVEELAGQMKIHSYIDGGRPDDRIRRIDQMRGFPLVRIGGNAVVSTMCTEKAPTDPIAAQLLLNLINTTAR